MNGYDVKDLEKRAIKAIEENNLFFISDVATYLPCSRSTFYNLGMDKLDSIKELLENNRVRTKSSMRSKWYKSQNATLQIALMKLIATDDERRWLTQSHTDITSLGEKIETVTAEKEDVQQLAKELYAIADGGSTDIEGGETTKNNHKRKTKKSTPNLD